MSKQTIEVVIGRGFGDEGKGMAVDWLCACQGKSLVVKHNGGGQAGHTVELQGKAPQRFVFHQLSSGSFRHAATLWADSFYPDLYKISEEIRDFEELAGFQPRILCDKRCHSVLIDDVLLNMLVEDSRGENRHGSCGMGINEADLRSQAGFGLTVSEIKEMSVEELVEKMQQLRKEYYSKKIEGYGLNNSSSEYMDLLQSDQVLENAAMQMLANAAAIEIVDQNTILPEWEHVIFETGQGLLLDAQAREFYPHVTASRTGLYQPLRIVKEAGCRIDRVVYVTRSYVTRHGAGPLPGEVQKEKVQSEIGAILPDRTNMPNPWQGTIRYGKYLSLEDMFSPIQKDLTQLEKASDITCCLLITHMNETDNQIVLEQEKLTVEKVLEYGRNHVSKLQTYMSDGYYAENIKYAGR